MRSTLNVHSPLQNLYVLDLCPQSACVPRTLTPFSQYHLMECSTLQVWSCLHQQEKSLARPSHQHLDWRSRMQYFLGQSDNDVIVLLYWSPSKALNTKQLRISSTYREQCVHFRGMVHRHQRGYHPPRNPTHCVEEICQILSICHSILNLSTKEKVLHQEPRRVTAMHYGHTRVYSRYTIWTK